MKLITQVVCLLLLNPLRAQSATTINPCMTHHEIIKIMMSLMLVIVFILLLAFLLKKIYGINTPRHQAFKILANLNFGTKEKVVLIEFEQRFLLLGVTAQQINLLVDYGHQSPLQNAPLPHNQFKDIFKKTLRSTDEKEN